MTWIERAAEKHKCSKPVWTRQSEIATGDVWECDDCGAQEMVTVHSDQREPGCWLTWRMLRPAVREV